MIIAIFASGKGSNFKAILDAIRAGKIRGAQIAVVLSNKPDSGALRIARESGIPAIHINWNQFPSDEQLTNYLLGVLQEYLVNFIVLAGFMKKIDPRVVRVYRHRIINIHPALLPSFGGAGMYGRHVHEAVLKAGEAVTGATVHLVDEEYDHGPIVLQRRVQVEPGETPETLAVKVLSVEHELYPEAIRLFAEGKVTVDAQHVTIMNSQ